jgi:phosphoribosylaminoimidazolecarboxamide formyltransferase/IMP cyclohydrolase
MRRPCRSTAIPPIDLVIVNLYPFAQTVAKKDCTLIDAVENIDIGGPTMVRAAAKNHGNEAGGVGIITEPEDYEPVLAEMKGNGGALSYKTRFALAKKAFTHTARYDAGQYFQLAHQPRCRRQADDLPRSPATGSSTRSTPCATARTRTSRPRSIANPSPRRVPLPITSNCRARNSPTTTSPTPTRPGSASRPSRTVTEPACVIVKHANPCGVAIAPTALGAYQKAFKTDPTSAFGGIIAFNCAIDKATAEAVAGQFAEVIIAPEITAEARAVFAAKQNLRVLIVPLGKVDGTLFDYKRVGGGLLVQTADVARIGEADIKVVTKRAPTAQEMTDLLFAWRVAKYVKSNAIVYCKDGMTTGVGAGQMSRVDSARIAAIKAENNGLTVIGSVAASDAFFPFRDGLDVLAKAGATAVIQPGGSVRDAEVIAAADEQNLAMVFTGFRHFRH